MAQRHHEHRKVPPTAANYLSAAFAIGEMPVESLVPTVVRKNLMPIVLLHGDYHTESVRNISPRSFRLLG